jgi:predicted MFS family arabinose efflux permease
VVTHPVIRWIILLSLVVNFVVTTVYTQFVLFAKQVLAVTDTQLGVIYAAAGISVVAVSLAAGPLSKRVPFGVLGLGALTLNGVFTIGLALSHQFWAGLIWWAGLAGSAMLWNITSLSLAQRIVPDALFGRVITFARLLSWAAIPAGTLVGGALIEWTHDVALIYGWIGGLMVIITSAFFFTPLGRVQQDGRYLPF